MRPVETSPSVLPGLARNRFADAADNSFEPPQPEKNFDEVMQATLAPHARTHLTGGHGRADQSSRPPHWTGASLKASPGAGKTSAGKTTGNTPNAAASDQTEALIAGDGSTDTDPATAAPSNPLPLVLTGALQTLPEAAAPATPGGTANNNSVSTAAPPTTAIENAAAQAATASPLNPAGPDRAASAAMGGKVPAATAVDASTPTTSPGSSKSGSLADARAEKSATAAATPESAAREKSALPATADAATANNSAGTPIGRTEPAADPVQSTTDTDVNSTNAAASDPGTAEPSAGALAAETTNTPAPATLPDGSSATPDSTDTVSLDGTGVAIMGSSMKNPQETNKVAGPSVKVLPVGEDGQAAEKILPTDLLAAPLGTGNQGMDSNSNFSNGNGHGVMAESTSALDTLDLPSLADARMRALERTHDMVALHSMRLVESTSDMLSVVIKPAVGMELSLELRQRGDEVEAQATVLRGDHHFLSAHWPDLQQRLEQRGIKLSALGGEIDFSANGQGQFQQSQTSQEEAAQRASAFAEFASAGQAGGATARLATIHDGWESWA